MPIYYAVKFNAEGNSKINYKGQVFTNPGYDLGKKGKRNSNHQFTNYLEIQAYPSIVFFDEKSEVILPLAGFLSPRQLELYLKLFIDDTHKKITSRAEFEAYQKEFLPRFKN